MLENEPSWLAVLGPRSSDDDPDPSAIEFIAESERSFSLRVHPGAAGAEGLSLAHDDGCAVLLDGGLHDRPHLAARRAADTDAELVLAAYLELGEQMLSLLRGSFTLVVWDGRKGSALCTRDLSGSHPLFFSHTGNRVLVSASHGALLEVGRIPADLDRVAIARWVLSWAMLPRRTFYARIARLPPGYVLRAAPDGIGMRRYWHPGDQAPTEETTPSEAFRRFEELLDQAVARSASAGRLGVFLSGGVDSAAVAASAAFVSRARSRPEPVALSLVYPERGANEEATQRSVAASLGIPHRVLPLLDTVGREGLLMAALRLTERLWVPPINPWEPGFVRLAEEGARLGCRIILTGEGGNDWFEAERSEGADLIRRLRLVALWRLWSRERQAGRPAFDAARLVLWSCGCRPLARELTLAVLGRIAEDVPQAVRRRRLRSSLPGGWALPDGALRTELVAELLEGASSVSLGSYRDAADLRKLESVHLVVGFENRFLVSRGLGVRFAEPAVDPDLIQFLYGLANVLLDLDGRFKGLPRESVRRRAGEGSAALLGYAWLDAFFASLVRAEGPPALETLGGLRRLSALGIVDERAFSRELRGPGLGKRLGYYEAWQALACEAWLRSRT
jgi:asparagine synthase (glutamine-hydrolysing)